MKRSEDFVISAPYMIIAEDQAMIDRASPEEKDNKDWENDCLDDQGKSQGGLL